jgi:hypothetical protein
VRRPVTRRGEMARAAVCMARACAAYAPVSVTGPPSRSSRPHSSSTAAASRACTPKAAVRAPRGPRDTWVHAAALEATYEVQGPALHVVMGMQAVARPWFAGTADSCGL